MQAVYDKNNAEMCNQTTDSKQARNMDVSASQKPETRALLQYLFLQAVSGSFRNNVTG